MPWARLDDAMHTNRKVMQVSNHALAVWMCSVTYSSQNLSDGVLNQSDVDGLIRLRKAPLTVTKELVAAGLWDESGDGYIIHDFRRYVEPLPTQERDPIRKEWESVSYRVRPWIFARDSWRCRQCGESSGYLEVDHIMPISKGGTNDSENLQTLCRSCNRAKGAS